MDRRTPPHVRLQHLLRTLPEEIGTDRVQRLLEISDLWGAQGDFDEAHASAAAAYDLANEIDSVHFRALALAARAKADRHRDREEPAMMDSASAADLFSSLAEWEFEIHSRLDVVTSALNLELYQEAHDQAAKALAVAEGVGDEYLIGRSALRFAHACRLLEKNHSALEHATRARTLLHGDAQQQSLACDLIAGAHIALGAPDQALHYLEQSMVIMEAIGRGEPPFWERLQYARGLRLANRPAEARPILLETIELHQDWDPNIAALGRCFLELAQIMRALGDNADAQAELHHAWLLLEVAGTSDDAEEYHRLKAEWS